MKHVGSYSPEVRERAVRLVFEHEDEHDSQWAQSCSVADKIGCSSETLRHWARQAERDQGRRPGLTTEERKRLKELERENRELKRANEILRKASAFSPRRSSTADPRHGEVHRRAPRRVWSRAHLRGVADCPVDVLLRPQDAPDGSGPTTGASQSRQASGVARGSDGRSSFAVAAAARTIR